MPSPILKSFWQVLKNPVFIVYSIAGGAASSGLYAYLSGSPFVMMDIFGLNQQQYGRVFGIIAAGLITTSQINSLMLRRFKSEDIAKYALMTQASVGILLLVLTITGNIGLYSLVFLIFCFLGCQGFVFPNTSALALNPFSTLAGSASALLGSIQLGIGAVASALVAVFHNYTMLPMVAIMTA